MHSNGDTVNAANHRSGEPSQWRTISYPVSRFLCIIPYLNQIHLLIFLNLYFSTELLFKQ